MLTLSIIRHDERLTVTLSGRLESSSAEDLRLAACPPSALDIDLSGVTSIDCEGERALVWLRDHGATLPEKDCLRAGYAKVPNNR